ncbi:MAG TPA: ester cyclase [Ktedonosporobacter sp.]|nr:ester cyclase [Ktedonosporobacter sp.]
MSIEKNRAAFAAIPIELFNGGNLAATEEYVRADYVEHMPLPPGLPSGLEGLKAFVTMVRSAFPDFHYTIQSVIAEGDLVAGSLIADGTNTGPFMGMPPTGKHITWTEMHFGRMVDGKLAEHWGVVDQLTMLQQLGVIPAPGQ